MSSIERSSDQIREIQAVGMYLVREQGTGIVKKLQSQGVFPPGAEIEIKLTTERDPMYVHPEFTFHREENIVTRGEKQHRYARLEGQMLDCLSGTPSRVVSHEVLAKEVWGYEDRKVGVISARGCIAAIRAGLTDIGVEDPSSIIVAHRGVGYELRDPSIQQRFDSSLSFRVKTEETQEEVAQKTITHPLFIFEPDRRLLRIDEDLVRLTTVETEMLNMLVRNRNRIVDVGFLMEALKDGIDDGNVESVKVHISSLRKKIINGREIEDTVIGSERGVGYILLDYSKMKAAEAENMKKIYKMDNRSRTRTAMSG